MWPTVNRLIKAPTLPRLIIEPNWPLVKPNCALKSGNLGIQDMMPKPNKKKSLVKVLNSASGVITCLVIGPSRTEHLQERFEPLLVVDQLDLQEQRVQLNDL